MIVRRLINLAFEYTVYVVMQSAYTLACRYTCSAVGVYLLCLHDSPLFLDLARFSDDTLGA